jgi:hypothetical protein
LCIVEVFEKKANGSCLILREKRKTRIFKNATGDWEEKRNNTAALPA